MVVWRRAPFRLNIATHSLSSVREHSQKDLFLPLTDIVPQTGLSFMTLLICKVERSTDWLSSTSVSCSSAAYIFF